MTGTSRVLEAAPDDEQPVLVQPFVHGALLVFDLCNDFTDR